MPHEFTLIATVSAALSFAFVFGFLAAKLRLPPIVGYLMAGIAVGPFTPGVIVDTGLAPQLAEIGVILLMFGVGIHFSVRDLLDVRSVAIPGAIGQIAVATVVTGVLSHLLGWPWTEGLVLGLAVSVASTVVLLRGLMDVGILDSSHGRIAVGWLIVEDVVIVVTLVLLPALAPILRAEPSAADPLVELAVTLAKVAAFGAFMLVVGSRLIPRLLVEVARTGSRELFTVGVLAIAIGLAFGASLTFGVSFALGAFLAGVVVGESDLSHQAAADALPLRDAFAVLFFVSVGMLFDPAVLLREPLMVTALLVVVMVVKALAAAFIVLLLGYPARSAAVVAIGLAQVGEFSFILGALGRSLALLPENAQDMIIATAIISIGLNPLLFRAVDPVSSAIQKLSLVRALEQRRAGELAQLASDDAAKLDRHVVVAGGGRVGSLVARAMERRGFRCVVIDLNRRAVERLRKGGILAMSGDAGHNTVLRHARLDSALLLIVAIPDAQVAGRIVEFGRSTNDRLSIVARAHSDEAAEHLRRSGADEVVLGEEELAIEMARYGLRRLGVSREEIGLIARGLRRH